MKIKSKQNLKETVLKAEKYRWSAYHEPGYEWDPQPEFFRSWNDVMFVNRGKSDAFNVLAAITCKPVNVKVIKGKVELGDIPAGGSAWSKDFYQLETDMTNQQDQNKGIEWTVEYDDSEGQHHRIVVSQHTGKSSNCI